MFSLFWNLSAALNGYLRFYMPTNRAIDWLRTPRGLKWAIPVALVATPTYLFAMSVCAVIIERGGPGYLNVLVLLFAWNSMKFAVLGAVSPLLYVRTRLRMLHAASTESQPATAPSQPVRD